jgi:hypothetical protein
LQSHFHLRKQLIISSFFIFFFAVTAMAQRPQFSLATDLGLQHSFKKGQRFWAIGQTIHTHFNFTPKDGAYSWISYYSNGNFSNDVTATAKLPATVPQQVNYINSAQMRFKQFSLGWKHYFKGAYNAETSWNLYGYAGFGILFGRVINTQSVIIDTVIYHLPVLSGTGNFSRLTADLGLGWELPLGGDVYFYNEARLWIPASDYPSKYVFVNKDAPWVGSLNFGFRIIF